MTISIQKRVQALQSVFKVRNIKALFDAMFVDTTAMNTYLTSLSAFMIADGIINASVVAIGSTPENVATSAFQYQIEGVPAHKAAVTAGTAFTDADTINTATAAGSFWGAWLVQITLAGTITTHSVGADQVYTTEALAIAALPAAEAGNVAVGYVTVQSNSGAAWTAGTSDLTAASDCLLSNFYSATTDVPAAPTLTVES